MQYSSLDTVLWSLDAVQWSHAAIDAVQWPHTALDTVQWSHTAIDTVKGSHLYNRQKLHICTACTKLDDSCPKLHEIDINVVSLYRGGL